MGKVVDLLTGKALTDKMFGADDSAAKAQKQQLALQREQEAKARQEAQASEAERSAAEEEQRKKRANVAASGRKSTLLAGENETGKSLLGG